jgi:phosphatidylglycerophosphate synthase
LFRLLAFYQKWSPGFWGVFVIAGITDGLDGLVLWPAAFIKTISRALGRILDPIADKLNAGYVIPLSYSSECARASTQSPMPSHLPIPF